MAQQVQRLQRGGQADLDVRVAALEAGQAGNQTAHREGRGGAHAQGGRRAGLLHLLRGQGQPVEHGCRLRGEGPTRLRQHQLRRRTAKQRCAQPFLQQRHLPAHRAMGDVQLRSRSRETHVARRGLEGADRFQRRKLSHMSFTIAFKKKPGAANS